MAGLFTFSAGVVVIHREKAHAAISSVNIQAAPILLLGAGILSLLLACLGISFIKKKLTYDGVGKTVIIVVSSIVLYSYPATPTFFTFLNNNLYSTHSSCL